MTAIKPDHRQKTKQGIAKARANGVLWGTSGATLAKQNKDDAQAFAETLRHLIVDLLVHHRCTGPTSLAREMNDRGIKARNGTSWYPNSVYRVMKRLRPSLDDEVSQGNTKKSEKIFGKNVMRGGLSAWTIKHHGKGR